MQVDATIFGGLPVVVELTEQMAEPDVGIMSDYVEIDAIYTMRVRKRDHRMVLRPIPASWWDRLDASGELGDLACRLTTDC